MMDDSSHTYTNSRQATIVGLDRLGMFVKVESKYGSSKLRLPFTRECTDRKVGLRGNVGASGCVLFVGV